MPDAEMPATLANIDIALTTISDNMAEEILKLDMDNKSV
jgi:hypothetical protein